ncbi:MAG: adenine deaminase [Saprospiraceae bacterium]|nr:adenine deaminase [Saprospiraceae bacterium]
MTIKANLVDIHKREIFPAAVSLESGKIASIERLSEEQELFILPGFVDAHVHIESSMLVPSEFARLAVVHGTVATVSDPHEIANVLGREGVKYMVENGKKVPFKFNFGAPSCVPATPFETAGARIGPDGIKELLQMPEIKYLAEMMNYPGVLMEDGEVMAKLKVAKELGKPVDGHAPGLRGKDAHKYIDAGISTDHECFTYEEALEKIKHGMKIIIREGSAARNFAALIDLLPEFPDLIMLCSDDKHPDDLIEGHINKLVARGIREGYDLYDLLRAASLNPVRHYGLEVGLLREGDPADFALVSDLEDFEVLATYIDGEKVAEKGKSLIPSVSVESPNNFRIDQKKPEDFRIRAEGEKIQVIQAINGEIVTGSFEAEAKTENGWVVSDIEQDVLKLVVVNRYRPEKPAVAFVQGFKLGEGALASCVAHDSHNIIAVGIDDEAICRAVNLIIKHEGGISAVSSRREENLPLPVAGIMSAEDGYKVGKAYARLDKMVKEELGSILDAPFMTLSFMALLVIPDLKLSDKGLFDGKAFKFVPLFPD